LPEEVTTKTEEPTPTWNNWVGLVVPMPTLPPLGLSSKFAAEAPITL